jgi:hypothetical protein
MDPEQILSAVDCETERTPQELILWVEEKSKLFGRSEHGKNYARSRTGLARNFIDHIYPLSRLAKHLFAARLDVVCKPSIDDRDFNAIVVDYRDRPLKVHKLKFVHAIHAYEAYLQRVYLPEQGFLSAVSSIMTSSAHDGEEPVNNIAWLNKSLELIAQTIASEIGKHYGRDTSLVVVFDDYAAFRSHDDLAALERFVSSEILPMQLNFSKLFLLGWSGHTLLSFSLAPCLPKQ